MIKKSLWLAGVTSVLAAVFCLGWGLRPLQTTGYETLSTCPLIVEPLLGYREVYEDTNVIGYRFSVRNSGDRPIKIQEIRGSCSCTVIKVEQDIVDPGKSVEFLANYSVSSLFGELPTRRITIATNDLRCSQLSCEVSGKRHRRFTIDPPTVNFGSLETGTGAERTVQVLVHGAGMRLDPNRLIGTSTNIFVELVDHRQELTGETVQLKIGINREAPIGDLDEKVFIPRLEDDGVGPVIPVLAKVNGPVRSVPPVVFVGTIRFTEKRKRVFQLLGTNEATAELVRVTGFASLPKGIQCVISQARPDTVEVIVDPSQRSEKEDLEEAILVQCEFRGQPHQVHVPVRGRISL